MKKAAIGLLVAVAACVLLLPPVMGIQAQRQLEATLQRVSERSNGVVELVLGDYERGWFSSAGRIRGYVRDDFLADNPELHVALEKGRTLADVLHDGIEQDVTVTHGPLILGESTKVGLGELVMVLDGSGNPDLEDLLAQTGNDYFIRNRVIIGLAGYGAFTIDAPPFTLASEDHTESAIFAGAEASGQVDLGDMHGVASGQINGMSLIGPQARVEIGAIRFEGDVRYPASDPYGLGTMSMTLDRLVATDPDAATLNMNDLAFSYTSARDANGQVTLVAVYETAGLVTGEHTLEDLQLGLRMTTSAAALVELQRLGQSLQSYPEPEGLPAEANRAIHGLLAGNFALDLEPVHFVYQQRPLTAALRLRAKTDALPPPDQFVLTDPTLMMALFTIELDLQAHKALAVEMVIPQLTAQLTAQMPEGNEIDQQALDDLVREQAQLMLATLVDQGILRRDGDDYVVTARYDAGSLLINDQQLPLGALMGNAFGAPGR